MTGVTIHAVPATIHGRYLVRRPAARASCVLIGFHGYAETAETQFARLETIPGADHALIVSVQGLHRFYRGRSEEVVASWMTRQDRELALTDNLLYVASVVNAVVEEDAHVARVFAGFSQGVATAFRAASVQPAAAAVMAVGGDIPPELDAKALSGLSHVLLARGTRDDWYTADKWESDRRRLLQAGVELTALELDAAHEWSADFSRAAGELLGRLTAG